jgi:hypothetical protein
LIQEEIEIRHPRQAILADQISGAGSAIAACELGIRLTQAARIDLFFIVDGKPAHGENPA